MAERSVLARVLRVRELSKGECFAGGADECLESRNGGVEASEETGSEAGTVGFSVRRGLATSLLYYILDWIRLRSIARQPATEVRNNPMLATSMGAPTSQFARNDSVVEVIEISKYSSLSSIVFTLSTWPATRQN